MVRLEVNDLCEECPLKAEFTGSDVFANINGNGRSLSGAGTEFYIGDGNRLEGFFARGVIRTPDILDSFNECERAVSDGKIISQKLACGAIARLQRKKEN